MDPASSLFGEHSVTTTAAPFSSSTDAQNPAASPYDDAARDCAPPPAGSAPPHLLLDRRPPEHLAAVHFDSPPVGAIEPPPTMATEHGYPPGFRFVPTDEELVKFCLLPRIQDQPLLPNDIIEDDPLSAPPWALLEKHGRRHQAFFFAKCQAMNAKGNRQKRTCEGHGTWQGQGKGKRKRQQEEGGQEQEVKKKLRVRVRVRGSAEKVEIEWDKYVLNFHEHGVKGSTGWVMHEYSITAPPELARSPERVYCIRFSGHGRNAKRNSRDAQHRGDDDEFEDPATCSAAEEVDDDAAGAIATAACAAAEEDPALLYPPAPQLDHDASFPVMVADVANPNPAGYDQGLDLPGLVDDDSIIFMNSLPDLLPSLSFDFSQWAP